MATKSSILDELERELEDRGYGPNLRRAVRSAKIAVIDDKVEELASFVEGLRAEGFSHIVEISSVTSINSLVDADFDLIVLDLVGVATELVDGDGTGVLSQLKRIRPALPVIVVTGTSPSADKAAILGLADAIRTKPIRPADLASEVEEVLKHRKDSRWAALAVLRELRAMRSDVGEELGVFARSRLWLEEWRLVKGMQRHDPNLRARVLRVADIVRTVGVSGSKIYGIAHGIPK